MAQTELPQEIQDALDQGFRVLLYRAVNDDVSPELGPYRAQIFKFPRQPGSIVGVGSAKTLSKAVDDIAKELPAGLEELT